MSNPYDFNQAGPPSGYGATPPVPPPPPPPSQSYAQPPPSVGYGAQPPPDPFAQFQGPPPSGYGAPPPPPPSYGQQSPGYQQPQPQGPPAPDYVDLDEQVGGFTAPPLGTHQARLATCTGDKLSQKGGQMVTATFEIISGEHAGREARVWRSVTPKWNQKTNKWNSPGVAEIREELARAGRPLPPGFKFPTNGVEAARIYHQGLAGVAVTILVTKETAKPGEKDRFSTKIVGPAGTSAVGAAQMGDIFGNRPPG